MCKPRVLKNAPMLGGEIRTGRQGKKARVTLNGMQ
jgi:hypothetical protein